MVSLVPQKSLSGVITSEDKLIEKPGLDLLEELGWKHANLIARSRVRRTPPDA